MVLTVASSNDESSDELPPEAKRIQWFFKKTSWKNHPFLASVTALIMVILVAGFVVGVVAGVTTILESNESIDVPAGSDRVSWLRLPPSCETTEVFLEQVKDELSCGVIHPLNHPGNEALKLQQSLESMRSGRSYADYLIFYSSPLGGNRQEMHIAINEDVEAVVGVRLFEKVDSQIVAKKPLREISRTLSFSESNLAGIERVLIFVFPLSAGAAKDVKEKEFIEFATVSFEEESP